MAVDRKRKTKTPKEVPEPGDPDRKRVLNVLAQRRYRERRKAKFAALEAQAEEKKPDATTPESELSNESPVTDTQPQTKDTTSLPQLVSGSSSDEAELVEEIIRDTVPQEQTDFPPVDFNQEVFDMQLLEDIGFGNPLVQITSPSSTGQMYTEDLASSYSWSMGTCATGYPLSPDGGQLGVPVLNTIRAFTSIANLLDIINKVYDPTYLHVLSPVSPPGLPVNLHPTTAQMTIPHHPFLDALPWPSVREKLICIFSMPSMCRPPIAQDKDMEGPGQAIMRLALDVDDYKDGVRVHGNLVGWDQSSELAEDAWEIGELFYRNWWWCLDGKVIGITNRRRRERGLGPLTKMYEGGI